MAKENKKPKELLLYSNGCPKCEVAKKILERDSIKFKLIDDMEVITKKATELGIRTMPFMIVVDGSSESSAIGFSEMHKLKGMLEETK